MGKDILKNLEGLPLTRRGFLKGAAGAFIAASMGPSWRKVLAQSVNAPPEEWDEVTDVLVVGTGFAGLAASLETHDAGVDVLTIEKAPEKYQGGNSRVSMNAFFVPKPKEKAFAYCKAMAELAEEYLPDDVAEAWAEEMSINDEWLRSMGVDKLVLIPGIATSFPELPGAEGGHVMINRACDNQSVWIPLKKTFDERGIRALYEMRAKKLIQDPDTGEILGVVAEHRGEDINIKARRGVVLACGGIENDPETQMKYCPYLNTPGYGIGTPYNTGDGIRMCQGVGADLWHMEWLIGPFYAAYRFPGTMLVPLGKEFIFVDGNGRRFSHETQAGLLNTALHCHGHMKVGNRWVPNPTPANMHMIFDESLRRKGSILTGFLTFDQLRIGWNSIFPEFMPKYSSDNMEEIRKGWIIQADSIRELAGKINMDPSTLEGTVSNYHFWCSVKKDFEFGRVSTSLGPIDNPPFYAVRMVPMIIASYGGARHNARAQIVDTAGNAIPRLYSAGEFGSTNTIHQGGSSVAEACAFGRIAGRNAAREVRR